MWLEYSKVLWVLWVFVCWAAGQGNDKTVEDVQAILRYRERTMSKIREDCLGIIQTVSSSSCKFPIISLGVAKWFSWEPLNEFLACWPRIHKLMSTCSVGRVNLSSTNFSQGRQSVLCERPPAAPEERHRWSSTLGCSWCAGLSWYCKEPLWSDRHFDKQVG